jgi:hypothetical protein
MEHKVEINQEGNIEITYDGEVTQKNHQPTLEKIVSLADQLGSQGKPVNFLVDLTKVQSVDPYALPFAIKAVRDVSQEKIACYNASDEVKVLLRQIGSGARKASKFKVFETKVQAEDWLLQ